ncbi:hypothetical protein OAD66_00330 [Bacteroidia bacterium]|nr:hypothetical protein [Bacteroidia bacterium]
MMDENTYLLINDYLDGSLKGRALDKFKTELKTDSVLQEAVAEQEAIIAAIQSAREQELKSYLNQNLSKKTKIFSFSPKLKIGLATAAAIALLVVVFTNISPRFADKDVTTSEDIKESPSEDFNENKVPADSSSTKEGNSLANKETTEIDTQTLAVVTPQPQVTEDVTILENEEKFDSDLEDKIVEILDTAVEKDLVEANTTQGAKPKALEKKEEEIVVSDKLLTSRFYTVSSISPDFSETISTETVSEIEVATTSKRRDRKKKVKAASESLENSSDKVTASRNVNVEYWQSVVNYKGYKYDGAKVQLYGMEQSKPISFKELDDRLYLSLNGKQYFLEKNKKYNRMVEVTNSTLLKVLND